MTLTMNGSSELGDQWIVPGLVDKVDVYQHATWLETRRDGG